MVRFGLVGLGMVFVGLGMVWYGFIRYLFTSDSISPIIKIIFFGHCPNSTPRHPPIWAILKQTQFFIMVATALHMEVGAGDNPLSQAHPAHWLGSQALVGGARKIAISQTASLLCTHCYLCICPPNLCGVLAHLAIMRWWQPGRRKSVGGAARLGRKSLAGF